MVPGFPRRKASKLLVCACAVAVLGGCTASDAGRGALATAPTSSAPRPTQPVLVACTDAQIRSVVERFFSTWDRHDAKGFGSLFAPDGILDMATKYQDTLRTSAYAEAVGPSQIDAFAEQQWGIGETLAYHGMDLYPPQYGAGGGAEVNEVSARFADGSIQQVEEAKFNYSCTTATLTHVVIISADVARKP